MIQFHILTLFPEMFPGPLSSGIIGKNINKKWNINTYNIRDYSDLTANSVDDSPYGGGAGMVLRPDVISKTIEQNFEKTFFTSAKKICFSAKGKLLNHKYLKKIDEVSDIILLCGRYEGIDQRVIDFYNFEEISIGDYVLNGGELASMVFMESLIRLQDGVLGNKDTLERESFVEENLLEHAQYTRPATWNVENLGEITVPNELISGNHEMISLWRQNNAEKFTEKNRPDLWKNYLSFFL